MMKQKKQIRFSLIMKDGNRANTLEELRQFFSVAEIHNYFFDGRLEMWLRQRKLETLAEEIAKIPKTAENCIWRICRVLGIPIDVTLAEQIEAYREMLWRKRMVDYFSHDAGNFARPLNDEENKKSLKMVTDDSDPGQAISTDESGMEISTHWSFDFLIQIYGGIDKIRTMIEYLDKFTYISEVALAPAISIMERLQDKEKDADTFHKLVEVYNIWLDSAVTSCGNTDVIQKIIYDYKRNRDFEDISEKYDYEKELQPLQTSLESILLGIIGNRGEYSEMKNKFGIDPITWVTECFVWAAKRLVKSM